MNIDKLSLADIRFDPEQEAYRAVATVLESGTVFMYPVWFNTTPEAEFGFVMRHLGDKARDAHRAGPSKRQDSNAALPTQASRRTVRTNTRVKTTRKSVSARAAA